MKPQELWAWKRNSTGISRLISALTGSLQIGIKAGIRFGYFAVFVVCHQALFLSYFLLAEILGFWVGGGHLGGMFEIYECHVI